MMKRAIFLIFSLVGAMVVQAQLSAKEVLMRNQQLQNGNSSYSEMTMQIIRPKWTREISMKSWTKGDDYALTLITAPAKDKGQAFLKRKKELWNWIPSIDRIVKMSASVMGQSWMGSDFTNGDMVQGVTYLNDYTYRLLEERVVDGQRCHQIELIPLPESPVVWGKVIASFEKENCFALNVDYYDERNQLVQTMRGLEVRVLGGRKIPTRMEMIPRTKKGEMTVMFLKKSDLNKSYSDSFFSQQNLKSVK